MNRRQAFTLLELVIVILILGIVAAIAVPRMANQTNNASTNASKQSLSVLRNAIELYRANNNGYPQIDATNTLPSLLGSYLSGPFPTPGVGPNASNSSVLQGTTADTSNSAGWVYSNATGKLIINGDATLAAY